MILPPARASDVYEPCLYVRRHTSCSVKTPRRIKQHQTRLFVRVFQTMRATITRSSNPFVYNAKPRTARTVAPKSFLNRSVYYGVLSTYLFTLVPRVNYLLENIRVFILASLYPVTRPHAATLAGFLPQSVVVPPGLPPCRTALRSGGPRIPWPWSLVVG